MISVSPNSKTLCIISFSSFSRTPSSCPTVTIVFNSSSVKLGPCSWLPPKSLIINPVIIFNTKTTGLVITQTKRINGAKAKTNLSAFWVARDLGVISPKIKIHNVTTPVAIATVCAPSPKIAIIVAVVSDEAPIFTRLFPTKIALNKRSWSSNKDSTNFAFLFPSSASVRILILLTDKKAVSLQENNDDKINKMINDMIFIIWAESTFTFLLWFYYWKL